MPEKKVSTPAADAPAAEGKTRKSTKAPARRGRPPLAPELYVEMGGEQYNITDIIDRAKADYRTTHKVGVQSCKVYVKPEEGAAYYVINKFSGKPDDSDVELNRWLERFHKVSSLRFVDNKKAAKVISALKAMAARHQDQN